MFDKLDQIKIQDVHRTLETDRAYLKKIVEHLVANPNSIYKKFFFEEQEKLVLPPKKKASTFFRFRQYQFVNKPIEEAFEFFSDATNLERITPSQLSFKIKSQSTEDIQEGTEFVYKLKIHGFPATWKTMITNWDPPFQFVDYQLKGPYQVWFHNHLFVPTDSGTLLIDEVKFILPMPWISNYLVAWFIKRDVSQIFDHRFHYMKQYYAG